MIMCKMVFASFQSTRFKVPDTTYFFAASIVRATGSIQSGLAPVDAGRRPNTFDKKLAGGNSGQTNLLAHDQTEAVKGLASEPRRLPTLDNLRNLFLRPTTEMLSFLQQVRETA